MTRTLARRLVPAFGIALASSLLLGALAAAADGGADPALPARFGVASPRQGDAWHYNATLTGFGDGQPAATSRYAPFAALLWAGVGQARGADGRLHTANLLALDSLANPSAFAMQPVVQPAVHQEGAGARTAWTLDAMPVWVQAGSRDVVQSGFVKVVQHMEADEGLAGGVGASVRRSTQVSAHTEFGAPPHCLAWNALQGTNVTLDAPLELFGACQAAAGFLLLPEGLRFKATTLQSANGVQAVRFDSEDGAYAAWFAPSIPYPVRLEARFPDAPGGEDLGSPAPARSLVLELAGFQPGGVPLAAVDRPTGAAPPLAFAPRTPWGLDDSGVVHPFTLSAAYAAAKEDPLFPDLRAFLAAHPEAYAAAA
ncbi:MAG TPA: hypothetical protein VHI93_03465, partial [Candidatus Thermoplasmatota archaeon]|nr:hypothetical protein [Candidatus Thermoplasmatota archaeon]